MRTLPDRTPPPERLCNLQRLLQALESRGLDGIVATSALNVFYLSGFNAIAHKSNEPRPYAIILSRHQPEHPIAVVADYYLTPFLLHPGWIDDVRPFRAVMMSLDLSPRREDIDCFIPEKDRGTERVEHARRCYAFEMSTAVRGALEDLGLASQRVAFDDVGFGSRLGLEKVEVADGYDAMMFARAVKTRDELVALERATRLNQIAIERTVATWEPGMTWRQLDQTYNRSVVDLGGFVRDPGGMVWGHPRGADTTIHLHAGHADTEIPPGTHVMFDCHGTLDLYCWDGGKTWVVDGEPVGDAKRNFRATTEVAQTLLDAMRPGVRVSELQAGGRRTYQKCGVPEPDKALIYFHGIGLSHMDLELMNADGEPQRDWRLEEGMVVALHLLYPGSERERSWVEEVVVVTREGGRGLFSWGFEPLTGI